MYNSNQYNQQQYNQSNIAAMNPIYTQSPYPKVQSELTVWKPSGTIIANSDAGTFPPITDVYPSVYAPTY